MAVIDGHENCSVGVNGNAGGLVGVGAPVSNGKHAGRQAFRGGRLTGFAAFCSRFAGRVGGGRRLGLGRAAGAMLPGRLKSGKVGKGFFMRGLLSW